MIQLKSTYKLEVIFFLIVIAAAHIVVVITEPGNYKWYRNTMSDLAAQGYAYKWLMQFGFIAFGGLILLKSILLPYKYKKFNLTILLIGLYGLFILITGIFCIKPFIPGLPIDSSQDKLHSLFASLTGLCITAGIFCDIFPVEKSRLKRAGLSLLTAISILALSMLFGMLDDQGSQYVGLVQRSFWILGLFWLYKYKP